MYKYGIMEQMFDEHEIDEQCICLDCEWEGYESELTIDEYDSYNMSTLIACNCPVCGGEDIG